MFNVAAANIDEDVKIDDIHAKFAELAKTMNTARSLYDEPYKDPVKREQLKATSVCFEHSHAISRKLSKECGTPVSNAYLKCFELLNLIYERCGHFVEAEDAGGVHFDNASLPGGWLLAREQWVRRWYNADPPAWYASSLMGGDALKDNYGLVAKYPDRWMMSKGIDGNVCNPAVLRYIVAQMKSVAGPVRLYTSDLGFDSSNDYSRQEWHHMPANLAQCLLGLLLLTDDSRDDPRRGSRPVFITKQYSMCEPFTLSLMALLSTVFEQMFIAKPMMSKSANQEMYVIGVGIRQVAAARAIEILKEEHTKLFNAGPSAATAFVPYDEGWGLSMLKIQEELAERMIKRIKSILHTYRRAFRDKVKDKSKLDKRSKKTKNESRKWRDANW